MLIGVTGSPGVPTKEFTRYLGGSGSAYFEYSMLCRLPDVVERMDPFILNAEACDRYNVKVMTYRPDYLYQPLYRYFYDNNATLEDVARIIQKVGGYKGSVRLTTLMGPHRPTGYGIPYDIYAIKYLYDLTFACIDVLGDTVFHSKHLAYIGASREDTVVTNILTNADAKLIHRLGGKVVKIPGEGIYDRMRLPAPLDPVTDFDLEIKVS